MKSTVRQLSLFLICSTVLVVTSAGCSADEKNQALPTAAQPSSAMTHMRLNDAAACHQVRQTIMKTVGVWPVAQHGLNESQAKIILADFTDLSSKTDGDLSKILSIWTRGFKVVYPYVLRNDAAGMNARLSEKQRETFYLSNMGLANQCQLQ